MKQWQQLAGKIDALTVRERVMVFAAMAGAVIFLVYLMVLDPLYLKQKGLQTAIRHQQNNIAGIDAEIIARVNAAATDPDAASRVRLQQVTGESAQLGAALRATQAGLVAPERVVPLLQTLLQSNGKLRLVSLKTLATDSPAGTRAEPAPPTSALEPAAVHLLFRHGVEITVQGGYGDMVTYMAQLEAMPSRLFWGKASLDVERYPNAVLTLTVYTLSMDKQWIKL